MAEHWKGAPVAQALTERLAARADQLKVQGIVPTLAIVRVGERPEDLSYERGALKRCEKVGIRVRQFALPKESSHGDLLEVIRQINADREIHGCLLFRPLLYQYLSLFCLALAGLHLFHARLYRRLSLALLSKHRFKHSLPRRTFLCRCLDCSM